MQIFLRREVAPGRFRFVYREALQCHRPSRHSLVELVERTDGAVTLAQVNREVAGFAKQEPPFWDHFIEYAGVETLYWDGMTEAGAAALQKVLRGRRVAVQFVSPVPYILDDLVSDHEHWQPIVFAPCESSQFRQS